MRRSLSRRDPSICNSREAECLKSFQQPRFLGEGDEPGRSWAIRFPHRAIRVAFQVHRTGLTIAATLAAPPDRVECLAPFSGFEPEHLHAAFEQLVASVSLYFHQARIAL